MSIALRNQQLAIYFEGNHAPRLLNYEKQPQSGWVIGRGRKSITFNDLSVSRNHAILKATAIAEDAVLWEIRHLGKNPTLQNGKGLPLYEWVPVVVGTYCFGTECVYVTTDWEQTVEMERDAEDTQNLSRLDAAIAAATPEKIDGWHDFAAVVLAIGAAVLRGIWRGPIAKPTSAFRVIWCGALIAIAALLCVLLMPDLLNLLR